MVCVPAMDVPGAEHEREGGLRFTARSSGPATAAARVQVRERFGQSAGSPLCHSALGTDAHSACCMRRPLLLGIFRRSPDHNGASISFDQRFFQQLPLTTSSGASSLQHAPVRLSPVSLSVTNLGATRGTRAYEPLASVAGLPRVLAAFPPSTLPKGMLAGV